MFKPDYHPNSSPEFVPTRELVHWGENHSDLWVRKLAQIVTDINHLLPLNKGVETALAEYDSALQELKYELDIAQKYQEEAERERNRARSERDALKLDLDKNEQQKQLTEFKSRVYNQSIELSKLSRLLEERTDALNELDWAHRQLQEKYNTWIAIAT